MGDDHSLASSQLSDVSSAAALSAKSELRFLEDGDLDLSLSISFNKRNKKIGSSSKAKHLEPRVYACDFCKKKFPTCQALGGHQNGHKMEREMMKQRRRLIMLGQDNYNYKQHHGHYNNNPALSAAMHHITSSSSSSYKPLITSNANILNTISTGRCDLSRNLIDSFRGGYDVDEQKATPTAADGVDLNLKL